MVFGDEICWEDFRTQGQIHYRCINTCTKELSFFLTFWELKALYWNRKQSLPDSGNLILYLAGQYETSIRLYSVWAGVMAHICNLRILLAGGFLSVWVKLGAIQCILGQLGLQSLNPIFKIKTKEINKQKTPPTIKPSIKATVIATQDGPRQLLHNKAKICSEHVKCLTYQETLLFCCFDQTPVAELADLFVLSVSFHTSELLQP